MVISCFAPAGINPAILDAKFLDSGVGVSGATSFTVAGLDFGVAHADRWLLAAIASIEGSGSTPTVTIGGESASNVVSRNVTIGQNVNVSIFKALVPTGTTGDVVVTGAGLNAPSGSVGLYRVIGKTIGATTDSSAPLASSVDVAVAAQAGDFLIAVAVSRATSAPNVSTSVAFTGGPSEDYDVDTDGQNGRSGGASYKGVPTTATVTTTATFSGGNPSGCAMAVASLRETF